MLVHGGKTTQSLAAFDEAMEVQHSRTEEVAPRLSFQIATASIKTSQTERRGIPPLSSIPETHGNATSISEVSFPFRVAR
jgi:hypothetical protein